MLDRAMKHLDPREAFEFLQQTPEAVFLDCRSETEYYSVGHPLGAIHVAWDARFVAEVRKTASPGQPLVLHCRSGNRSVAAGRALEEAGFTNVYNVRHGFEGELDQQHHRSTRSGWRFDGLPWEQC
jgi:rhodanese-related sulfurtransferase